MCLLDLYICGIRNVTVGKKASGNTLSRYWAYGGVQPEQELWSFTQIMTFWGVGKECLWG